MSTFSSVSLTQDVLDPGKRVNYTMGLVLGVDEFVQEQTYLMERDRLHNRALHGYGTVHGLDILARSDSSGPEIVVTPGMALDPVGRHICVPVAQCAELNPWLARQQQAGEIPGTATALALYVVLCYRECETDLVPIPGGPCRSQDETMAASRIADDFELKLALAPPGQLEEDTIRRFGALLERVVITAVPGEFATQAEVEDLVRDLAEEPGSPPEPGAPIRLHPDQAREILRGAFQVWVTEVRPALLGKGFCASASDTCVLLAELQLALTQVDGVLQVDDSGGLGVVVIDEQRPYLLTTRMLQEWLLAVQMGLEAIDTRTFATLSMAGAPPGALVVRAWIHHPVLLDVPLEAVRLFVDDTEVAVASVSPAAVGVNVFDLDVGSPPAAALIDDSRLAVRFDSAAISEMGSLARPLSEALGELDYAYLDRDDNMLWAYLVVDAPTIPVVLNDLSDVEANPTQDGQVLMWDEGTGQWTAGAHDHGELAGLGDVEDHPGYLVVDGSRPLTGNQSAGNNKITNLATADTPGDALPHGQPAGGDLAGTYPNPTVVQLQGNLVAAGVPDGGQVLTWDEAAGQWTPSNASGGVSDHGALTGLNDIEDHPGYLVLNGSRPLTGNQSAGNHKITALAAATAAGDAVRWEQAVKVGDAAGGDLGNIYPNPTVVRLQTRPVSSAGPAPGNVLTWTGSAWAPRAPQGPEPDLTRIAALSWRHGDKTNLEIELDGQSVFGLVIGFGKDTLGDGGQALATSLTQEVFQCFVEEEVDIRLFRRLRIAPEAIIPVKPIDVVNGLITEVDSDGSNSVDGALFLFDRGMIDKLQDLLQNNTLLIVVRGDFILDESGERAIDAEHVRAQLPTGDRPQGRATGIQGGLFESWVTLSIGG